MAGKNQPCLLSKVDCCVSLLILQFLIACVHVGYFSCKYSEAGNGYPQNRYSFPHPSLGVDACGFAVQEEIVM